jgi:YegS/Rv2252/BmrU family lipid kinase
MGLAKGFTMIVKRVYVVINPDAGQDHPILATLNRAFRAADLDWDIGITKADGDAGRLAQAAVQAGYDVVAALGGDGTVADVASSLAGSQTPLAILPGGTANVMAVELGVPHDLALAMTLLTGEHRVRNIDVGRLRDRKFLLRVGLGLEASMVEGAERELKDRVGVLAYGVSAVQALREPVLSTYRIVLDGDVVEATGVGCVIANVGSLGQGQLTLSPDILVDDGLLDVVVLERADLASLLSLASSVLRGVPVEGLLHWQAREVTVMADPPQPIQVDGEIIEPGPISAWIDPSALKVIVPTLSPQVITETTIQGTFTTE